MHSDDNSQPGLVKKFVLIDVSFTSKFNNDADRYDDDC